MATPESILAVRVELGDTDISLPVLSDEEIGFFIDKNAGNLNRATIDTAKTLMFKLSFRTDKTVDILSIKGSKTAANWIAALKEYLRNPFTNPLIGSASGWAGGISVSEMQANIDAPDNYVSPLAVPSQFSTIDNDSSNPFSI